MQTLLVNNEVFTEVPVGTHYETQYTTMLEQQAPTLFPGFHVCKFEPSVESSFGVNRPDLAIIDSQFRKWWVVEVELANHSLTDHVIPQVETFVSGDYSYQHAEYLSKRLPSISKQDLQTLITTVDPTVLVIVVGHTSDWKMELRKIGVELAFFTLYRSTLDKTIYGLDGDVPRIPEQLVAVCRPDRSQKGWLEILSPAKINQFASDERLEISLRGVPETWMVHKYPTCTLLQPENTGLVQMGRDYSLLYDESQGLRLERNR